MVRLVNRRGRRVNCRPAADPPKWIGRTGGRPGRRPRSSRDCSRSVCPGCSPNPACDFHRTGLSTVPRSGRCCAGCRGGDGDRVASLPVPGDRHRFEVEQLRPVRRDRSPPSIGGGEPAAHLLPRPAMQRPQPTDDAPPHEVGQRMQGLFGNRLLEVVGPAADDLVEPDQRVPGVLLRRPIRHGTNLGLQRPDRPVADEGGVLWVVVG